jgi:hypothetical protein
MTQALRSVENQIGRARGAVSEAKVGKEDGCKATKNELEGEKMPCCLWS